MIYNKTKAQRKKNTMGVTTMNHQQQKKVSEYDQGMAQSHAADQPTAS